MKIYPSKHTVQNVEKIDLNRDIQLGYFDSEYYENKIEVNIENRFKREIKKEILPYTYKTDTLDIGLYDNNMMKISDKEIKDIFQRDNNEYVYIPNNSLSFEPVEFTYKILAKKQMTYFTERNYNIKIKCGNEELAKDFICLFSDSNIRQICPSNIIFNNGDKKIDTLLTKDNPDFEIIYANYVDEININEYFLNNTIPIIIYDYDEQTKDEKEFNTKEDNIVSSEKIKTKYYFDGVRENSYEIDGVEYPVIYHSIFKEDNVNPILIKEIVNKGFVVTCFKENIKQIIDKNSVFYSLIMYLYMNSYMITNPITEWITNVMPDYIVQNGKLTKKDKFTSNIELHKMFGLYDGDVKAIDIIMNDEFSYKILTQDNKNYDNKATYNIICNANEAAANTVIDIIKSNDNSENKIENILFNNNSKAVSSFGISYDIDMSFIESDYGNINIDYYADNHIIPFIFCDKITENDSNDEGDKEFVLKENTVCNEIRFTTNSYLKNNGELINIFTGDNTDSPILIKDIEGKTQIIYCSKGIKTILEDNPALLYYTCIIVYLKRYKSVSEIKNLEFENEKDKDEIQEINTKEDLEECIEKYASKQIVVLNIETYGETPIVEYVSMNNNYLTFKKIYRKDNADPIKKDNQISIFTERKNVIYFDNFIYNIEDSIENNITCNILDNVLYVKIKPIRNSSFNIDMNGELCLKKDIKEPFEKKEIYLTLNKFTNNDRDEIVSKNFELVEKLENDNILVATIQVIKIKKDSKLYDMRQRGGGLSKEEDDNYNCLDIGGFFGRPYRKGGSLIVSINIPKKYKSKEEYIYNILYSEISKNMIAEDFLILKLIFI